MSDARMAVIVLNECDVPVQDFASIPPNPQPSTAFRIARRITLTTRNHFMRDNIYWKRGEAIYMLYRIVRNWGVQRIHERRMRAAMASRGQAAGPSAFAFAN